MIDFLSVQFIALQANLADIKQFSVQSLKALIVYSNTYNNPHNNINNINSIYNRVPSAATASLLCLHWSVIAAIKKEHTK